LEAELCCCHELRKENLHQLIKAAHSELLQAWRQCYITTDEHAMDITHAESSEDVLDHCEAELMKLLKYYETNKAIFLSY